MSGVCLKDGEEIGEVDVLWGLDELIEELFVADNLLAGALFLEVILFFAITGFLLIVVVVELPESTTLFGFSKN
jgi:hypothetical protein